MVKLESFYYQLSKSFINSGAYQFSRGSRLGFRSLSTLPLGLALGFKRTFKKKKITESPLALLFPVTQQAMVATKNLET